MFVPVPPHVSDFHVIIITDANEENLVARLCMLFPHTVQVLFFRVRFLFQLFCYLVLNDCQKIGDKTYPEHGTRCLAAFRVRRLWSGVMDKKGIMEAMCVLNYFHLNSRWMKIQCHGPGPFLIVCYLKQKSVWKSPLILGRVSNCALLWGRTQHFPWIQSRVSSMSKNVPQFFLVRWTLPQNSHLI